MFLEEGKKRKKNGRVPRSRSEMKHGRMDMKSLKKDHTRDTMSDLKDMVSVISHLSKIAMGGKKIVTDILAKFMSDH
ncbi:hypothetical protein DERF_003517 [Dermatophagoides farinae]|uniref:Uncharacterized protein n=1 Tax=Dermatophagoides farinae TaxID=6954 RepID=A0A922LDL1_DERFA|nr:hypothetical protein DERF_003517 [Dermatophagoides farinae]